MAIADLSPEYAQAIASNVGELGLVRVGVHDASRLEWSVTIPLPEEGETRYSIDVEIQIPSNAFARHSPWDQMQSFTRLDGPALNAAVADANSLDALRRGAVALANKLSRASDGFTRHCRVASSLFATAPEADLEQALRIWIDAARRMAAETRESLTEPAKSDAVELARERELVDEYVSIRLLEMLAGAERALSTLSESKSPVVERFKDVIANVELSLADALEEELGRRRERGWLCPDPGSMSAAEAYVERASRLKKHFQEVLFLEPEVYQVAERIHHWVAAFVAVVASTWAFVWQIALMNQAPSTGSQVGSGIFVLAVIAGLVYAGKDRIKEMGRNWISGNVHRLYAQRVARFRAPARRLPGRDVIVAARESIDQVITLLPDPLNPEVGATLPATLIRYTHKGQISPNAKLAEQGVRRIKHVYRYDLSPLFARLDDAVKPVPVLDHASRRVRFIDAPRCYRVPIKVTMSCEGRAWEESATLVLHKRGLDRLERKDDDSDPRLESGLEP